MIIKDDLKFHNDERVITFLTATRMIVCRAIECKNHVVNVDHQATMAGCGLKRIDLGPDGKCYFYEQKND